MYRYLKLFVAAALVSCVFASSAFAQWGGRPGRGMGRGRLPVYNNGFGGGGFTTLFDLYRSGDIPVPPYFSLHPPVYYDRIVPQAYGSSPFAYPYSWWQQFGYPSANLPGPYAHAPASAPSVIQNPYIPTAVQKSVENPSEGDDQKGKKVAQAGNNVTAAPIPQLIINPYVTADDELDSPQVRLAAGS